MSLIEQIDDLREQITDGKAEFESNSDEAQGDIENVVYNLEMETSFDNHFGGDWDEVASTYDGMAQMVREEIGNLQSVITLLEQCATTARNVYDAIEELGDEEY